MFGDAEHYKYLTNEADLNNVGDDSIALTPKTPKKEEYKLTPQTSGPVREEEEIQNQIDQTKQFSSDNIKENTAVNGTANGTSVTTPNGKVIGASLGNMSMAESMDGSFYAGYDSNKNINSMEVDNIPVEARPKAAG